MSLYQSRRDAGSKLSEFLKGKINVDTVIVPFLDSQEVALEVAENLNADLEVVLSELLHSPGPMRAEFGAVTEDSTIWVQDVIRQELELSNEYISSKSREVAAKLAKQSREMRGETGRDNRDLGSVLIVSDAVTSGFREAAVAGSLMKEGIEQISIATPFKSNRNMADLDTIADFVFCIHELPFIDSSDLLYSAAEPRNSEKTI